MHINAFVWEITRIRLRITRGFRGRPIQKNISDCKDLRDVAMATKLWPKSHKNDHNFSCMQHIHAEFGFEIGFVTSGIHQWHSHTQGTKGITMATNFGTRIAINAYNAFLWETTGMPLLMGVFVVGQSEEDICDCKILRHVATTTKFWPK